MNTDYPELSDHLRTLLADLKIQIPGPMAGFGQLHKEALAEGALDAKHKELIALGIAIAAHCDGCIALHVQSALKAHASPQEIVEAIGVAVLMGGGPAAIYGAHALEALEQFSVGERILLASLHTGHGAARKDAPATAAAAP